MGYETQIKLKRIIIICFIVFTVLMVFSTVTDITFAAGKDSPKWEAPNVTDGDDSEFNKKANIMKNALGLDIEDAGVLSKASHIGATSLATIANLVFALQVLLTYLAAMVLNWSDDMPWLESMAGTINDIINDTMGTTFFSFDTKSSLIYLAIFLAMAGICISFARMRVTEGVGNIVKIVVLIAMSIGLAGNGLVLYNNLNDTATDLKNKIVTSTLGGATVPETMWDINAIRPWKILEFGNISIKTHTMKATEKKGAAEGEDEEETPAVGTSYGYNVVTGSAYVTSQGGTLDELEESASAKWDWKNTKERLSWNKDDDGLRSYKGWKNMLGVFKDYTKYKTDYDGKGPGCNGHKMYVFLKTTDGQREEIASVMAKHGYGLFKLSMGTQGTRVAMALSMFILSVPLSLIALFMALLIIIMKVAAMFLFFLWPLVIIVAILRNSFDGVKVWITSVATFFLLGVLIQFISALVMSIVLSIFSKDVFFASWCLSCILSVALFVAVFLLYPYLMKTIGGTPHDSKWRQKAQTMGESYLKGKVMGGSIANAINEHMQPAGAADGATGAAGAGNIVSEMKDPTEMTDSELQEEMASIEELENGAPMNDAEEETGTTQAGTGEFEDDELQNAEGVPNAGTGEAVNGEEKAITGMEKPEENKEQAEGTPAPMETVNDTKNPKEATEQEQHKEKVKEKREDMESATKAAMDERRNNPVYKEKVKAEMEKRKAADAEKAEQIRKETEKMEKQKKRADRRKAVGDTFANPAKAVGNLGKTAVTEKVAKPVNRNVVQPAKSGVTNTARSFNETVVKPAASAVSDKSSQLTGKIDAFSDRIKKD